MKSLTGLNGKVIVDDENITLVRTSKFDGIFQKLGTTVIPITQIERVIYSEGGITNGYISFLKKGDKKPNSVFSAMKNSNTVIFRFTKNEVANQLAEYVNGKL